MGILLEHMLILPGLATAPNGHLTPLLQPKSAVGLLLSAQLPCPGQAPQQIGLFSSVILFRPGG